MDTSTSVAVKASQALPQFPNDPVKYQEYRDSIEWYVAGTEESKLHLLGPRLIGSLPRHSEASKLLRKAKPADYRVRDGAIRFLRKLDELFQHQPETELALTVEEFLAAYRKRNEATSRFAASWLPLLSRLEELITIEVNKESKLFWTAAHRDWPARQELHRQAMESYRVAADTARQTAAAEAVLYGGTADDFLVLPTEPVAPTEPPAECPTTTLGFPQVLTGYLFLRAWGGFSS